MSILGNRVLGGAGQQPYTVGRSLRFRSSASAYLNRTFTTPTNNKIFTWSAWVKRSSIGTQAALFDATSGSNECILVWGSPSNNDNLQFYAYNAGYIFQYVTNNLYRDPAAWYHIVVAMDTTQATANERCHIYVNGVEVSYATRTNPAQNSNPLINSAISHNIGRQQGSIIRWYNDGYLAEVNFIDGQALTPSSFGAYDNNGVWQPRKYGGTYGTNGFYLPFSSGFNTTQTYAGSFNGSNQFINVAASASLAPGTGDFTVEANVNYNAIPSSGTHYGVFENQIATTSASSDKFYFSLLNNAGTPILMVGQHSTSNAAYVNWTPTVGVWYHVAAVRQSGTIKIFINGVQQTVTNSTIFNGTNFGQNGASSGAVSTPYYFNGYISNLRYVVGTAVYTTGFTPPSSNLTAVANTQWLTLQNSTLIDNSSAARAITNNNGVSLSSQYPFQYTLTSISADYSGNGNNWTTNNINSTILGTTYDSMIDSPTNSASSSNYAVLNPTQPSGGTYQAGNQQFLANTAGQWKTAVGTMFATSGKYYWEVTAVVLATAGYVWGGAASSAINLASSTYNGASALPIGGDTNSWGVGVSGGNIGKYYNGSFTTITAGTDSVGDVWMIAVDIDAAKIWFGRNGTWLGSGDPATGANAAFTNLSGAIGPGVSAYLNSGSTAGLNCGQRPFTYTPPSGYKALNTYNLPQPTIMNGAKYMAATTYTGNGGTQTISNGSNNTTGVVFQPDFIWIKNRAAAVNHQLQNSNSGWQYGLNSNNTNAEYTDANAITGATSSGWSMNNNYNSHNQSGVSYIGWQWNAGSGVTSTNTNGSITSLVGVNPTAGFSIVSYIGTGAVATVGHGLGVAPNMIIWKNRSSVENWVVYHSSLGATGNVYLNLTNGFSADSTTQNNTAPTSSVFTVATSGAVNGSTRNIIAYCFSAVAGYSAFGSYTGNGSTDGPFVYTGFRPRWVMIKNAGGVGNWFICDTSRDTYNVAQNRLFPSVANAEATSPVEYDILSNGFKIRVDGTTDSGTNTNAISYIYAAFAENPFKISRAR